MCIIQQVQHLFSRLFVVVLCSWKGLVLLLKQDSGRGTLLVLWCITVVLKVNWGNHVSSPALGSEEIGEEGDGLQTTSHFYQHLVYNFPGRKGLPVVERGCDIRQRFCLLYVLMVPQLQVVWWASMVSVFVAGSLFRDCFWHRNLVCLRRDRFKNLWPAFA